MFLAETSFTQHYSSGSETNGAVRGRHRADWFQAKYTSATNFLGLESYNRHLRRDRKTSVTQKLNNWLMSRPDTDTDYTKKERRAKTYNPLDDITSTAYNGRHSKNGNGHGVTYGGEHDPIAGRPINIEPFESNQPSVNGENGNVDHRKTAGKHRSGTLPMLSGAALGGRAGYEVDLPGRIEIIGERMSQTAETVGTTLVGALVVSALAGVHLSEAKVNAGKYRATPINHGVDALSINRAFKHM